MAKSVRPIFVTVALLIQFIEVLFLLLCFFLGMGFGVLPYSLILPLMFMSLPLIFASLAVYGLWRRTSYGWWISIVGNIAGIAFVLVLGIGSWRGFVLIAMFSVIPALLAMPQSRSFFDVIKERIES